MSLTKNKFILDACCGGRMFWYDKHHPNALYIDNRELEIGSIEVRPNFCVKPDVIMDFRDLKFQDQSFKLVVWDPPHFMSLGPNSWMAKKYGVLDKKTWEQDLAKGFEECWRVLKNDGILIMKWSTEAGIEHSKRRINVCDVLKLFSHQPLFGHKTGTRSNTMWLCFMKIPEMKQ